MPEGNDQPQTVFVSYAHEDRQVAFELASELEARGILVWIDRRIRAGSHWDREIQAAINEAKAMVVLLSKHSVASTAVHDEFSLALDEGDLVIPLLLEKCTVPLRLRRLQWLDFSAGDRETVLESLIARLREPGTTVNPVSVPQQPESTRTGRRRYRSAALALLGVASAAGMFSVAYKLRDGGGATDPMPTKPTPASSHVRDSGTKQPESPDTRAGDEVLGQYETLADSRSRWLSVKSTWIAAAQCFEKALASLPATHGERAALQGKAAFARGRLALLEGHFEDAERQFRLAIVARASFAPPHLELASLYTRLGKYSEAHAEADLALGIAPDSWLARTAKGSIYAAEGKLLDSISVFEAARAKHDVPAVLGNLALAYHASRMHDARALDLAQQALQRDPDLRSALTVVAEHELEHGRPKKALEASQRMVDLAVFDVSAWLVHGDTLLALGRTDQARAALRRAVELFRESRQTGAPPERLKQVEEALVAGRLPAPRGASRSVPAPPRPGHLATTRLNLSPSPFTLSPGQVLEAKIEPESPRSRPAAGTEPRSKPQFDSRR
jgi:tetratricopeptide (TPR) repeat protein